MPPGAKLKYDQKYLKKWVKVMGMDQWGQKNLNCWKMYSLAANGTCEFSKPYKTVYKS